MVLEDLITISFDKKRFSKITDEFISSPIDDAVLKNSRLLWNITDGNLLRQNDDKCHHQIVILVEVVNDAAPWWNPQINLDKVEEGLLAIKMSH